MLRTILIGLDGSPYSASAAELGAAWGKQLGAAATGLGVVDEPSIAGPEPVPIGVGALKEQGDLARMRQARQHVEGFLEQFAQRCDTAGVVCQRLIRLGTPCEQLLDEARRHDLVLLGQRTYFHFATQDEPDDTLTDVLHVAPRPVVVVPERLTAGTSVVVAYDGSLQSARALQLFQTLGLGGGRDVHVVSIGGGDDSAERLAEQAATFLRPHGLQVTPHAVETTAAPADVILNQARNLDAGLIVMGAYGKSALRSFFLGSVTRTILDKSTLPLFVYH